MRTSLAGLQSGGKLEKSCEIGYFSGMPVSEDPPKLLPDPRLDLLKDGQKNHDLKISCAGQVLRQCSSERSLISIVLSLPTDSFRSHQELYRGLAKALVSDASRTVIERTNGTSTVLTLHMDPYTVKSRIMDPNLSLANPQSTQRLVEKLIGGRGLGLETR